MWAQHIWERVLELSGEFLALYAMVMHGMGF